MKRLYLLPIGFIGATSILNLALFGYEFAGLVLLGYAVLGFVAFGIYHSIKYTLDQRDKKLKNGTDKATP